MNTKLVLKTFPLVLASILGAIALAFSALAFLLARASGLPLTVSLGKGQLVLTFVRPRAVRAPEPEPAQEPTPVPQDDAAARDKERLLFALVNMGYTLKEASSVVSELKDRLGKDPVADLLKEALARLNGTV